MVVSCMQGLLFLACGWLHVLAYAQQEGAEVGGNDKVLDGFKTGSTELD